MLGQTKHQLEGAKTSHQLRLWHLDHAPVDCRNWTALDPSQFLINFGSAQPTRRRGGGWPAPNHGLFTSYDGYGDEGAIQSIYAFAGDEEANLPDDIVEALSDAACELLPAGWEISDGSFGELVLDVAGRTLTREHRRRVTETEYDEEDFQL